MKIIDDYPLRGCYFERTYFAIINKQLDSAFIDLTCYYADPLINNHAINSTFGWIAVLDAPILQRALDRLPNSLLMETKI